MKSIHFSNKSIFKGITFLGISQGFVVIFNILRSKLIAVLLGPVGLGLHGLYTSALSFLTSVTNFGLAVSSVKEINNAYLSSNEDFLKTYTIFKRLILLTGFFGFILSILLSSYLSKVTFGSYDYITDFLLLSITLLFYQLTIQNESLLRGINNVNKLIQSNVISAAVSFLLSAPIYYYFKKNGIIWSIIIYSLIPYFISKYFILNLNLKKVQVSLGEFIEKSKIILKLGFIISITNALSTLVSYLLRIFINHTSGEEIVGLYTAGFVIILTYINLILSSMLNDYYPKLSSCINEVTKVKNLIHNYTKIVLFILTPMITIFIFFHHDIISLLYSNEFLSISSMMILILLGMFIKSISYILSFLFLVKNTNRLFFFNELIFNLYFLFLSIIGFKYLSLLGLGISYLVSNLFYLIQVNYLIEKHIKINIDKSIYLIAFLLFILCCSTAIMINFKFHNFNLALIPLIASIAVSVSKFINIFKVSQ
ncbi:oligosaccharide flippase family protein [Thermaurantimonas aggregans]|uniref:oligosaccharide flippase family protein n=1 Tax=Thermaurantimonas aggregans TaxID=2173829 RepID=UPI00135ACC48|nr:oligosaccharide flippase family protein [Thermaurantimonas aggregans]